MDIWGCGAILAGRGCQSAVEGAGPDSSERVETNRKRVEPGMSWLRRLRGLGRGHIAKVSPPYPLSLDGLIKVGKIPSPLMGEG